MHRTIRLSLILLVLLCAAGAIAQDDPICTVTPDSLNFGTCWNGEEATLPLTITNTGGGLLEGSVRGDLWFSLSGYIEQRSFALAAGESLTVDVVAYERMGIWPRDREKILIETTDTISVPCHAHFQPEPVGSDVMCFANWPYQDFDIVTVGDVSGLIEFSVGNIESGAFPVTIPDRVGDFHINWPGEYVVTQRITRFVRFEPQTAGRHEEIFYPASLFPDCDRLVKFEAFAVNPYPSVSPEDESFDFGNVLVGNVSGRSVRLTNDGNEGVSGIATVSGEGYWIPEDQRAWGILPSEQARVTVYFDPEVAGESFGSFDFGTDLCDPIPLRATGIETSAQNDIIGIFFEQSGRENSFQTTEDFEEVTAYLMVINPSSTTGIRGWECCVEMTGAGGGLSFELAGEAMNVDSAPCFVVGMTGRPLFGDGLVTLATIRFWQPNPYDPTYFYVRPGTQPSYPDRPCYVDGFNEGIQIPLGWMSGNRDLPVAMVNESSLSGVTAPQPAVRQLGNYPNPFNPATTISFVLGAEGPVDLRIYDVGGRIVRTLLAGDVLAAGLREVTWDGRNENGRSVATGVYFYRIETVSHTETKRMTLVK